ncbi:MAG: S49 family peptidase [Alphaproteobacteria bacterium]|nr:S49 family peptidase [Alphaproteobacteria bacterium]
MIRALLRWLSRPFTYPLAALLTLFMRARVGRAGVVELSIDQHLDHPLQVLDALERLLRLTRARGLVLHLDLLAWGWATLEEWREGLVRLRDQGVLVVVVADSLDNRGMFLASAADRVLLPPLGEVAAVGVGGRMTFFGPALERLGVVADIESAGAFKSFGETYTRSHASAENREAVYALVDDLHAGLVAAISEGRGKTPEETQALIDRSPMAAEEALAAGLIDKVGYDDALDELLEELLGEQSRRVGVGSLAFAFRWATRLNGLFPRDPIIAVVHISGPVTSGLEPSRGNPRISPPEVTPVLRAMRDQPNVAAVVLSVQSPGGSALASDLIWREVELLVREKPVVAHFSDVAASGGYYLAAPANEIVARPGSITGSIGVVGGKLVVGKAAGSLGIHVESFERGRNVGMYLPDTTFDPWQRARFRARLQHTYHEFVRRVAAGRKRPYGSVEEVAQGRVWSGRRAVEAGLVDHLGGLREAIDRARALSGIRPAQAFRRADLVVQPPRPLWMRLLPGVGASVGGWAARLAQLVKLPAAAELLIEHPEQPLAVMPFEVELR